MSRESEEQVSFGDLVSGFSFDSARIRKRGKKKATRAEPMPEPDPYATMPFDVPPLPSIESSASIVRAYAWTGGRTTSDVHLEIETLVSVNEFSATAIRPEHQDVLALCHSPRSVAEIAALRGLPLGVTKVLLGDMASHGLIDVHRTASSYGGDRPDGALLERVLAGLRRL
ncbi:DUF742 domain-containing protein [Lentzea flava]|uniref:DUF742 domain-containing protein n=1 Tax=Lentzea flava TaxID=103732 RepID=A0ABQ2UDN1_9PSEU|nr:DUF742 domain-containing protein [Lentzea flava]MCP2198337.1 Protein of unknown function (DUF742) [Lentzea flava]GGU25122.1 hypothetical protein GCM10010178_16620 [Lentzea flava]